MSVLQTEAGVGDAYRLLSLPRLTLSLAIRVLQDKMQCLVDLCQPGLVS